MVSVTLNRAVALTLSISLLRSAVSSGLNLLHNVLINTDTLSNPDPQSYLLFISSPTDALALTLVEPSSI